MDAGQNASNKLEAKLKQTAFFKVEERSPWEDRILGVGSRSSQSKELRKPSETRTAGADTALARVTPQASTTRCSNPACTSPTPATLRGCTGCGKTQYCNVECQRAHWAEHKEPCKVAKLSATLSAASLHSAASSEPVMGTSNESKDTVPPTVGDVLYTTTNESLGKE